MGIFGKERTNGRSINNHKTISSTLTTNKQTIKKKYVPREFDGKRKMKDKKKEKNLAYSYAPFTCQSYFDYDVIIFKNIIFPLMREGVFFFKSFVFEPTTTCVYLLFIIIIINIS